MISVVSIIAIIYMRVPVVLVELALELDPVETQRVEEALHHVHAWGTINTNDNNKQL